MNYKKGDIVWIAGIRSKRGKIISIHSTPDSTLYGIMLENGRSYAILSKWVIGIDKSNQFFIPKRIKKVVL